MNDIAHPATPSVTNLTTATSSNTDRLINSFDVNAEPFFQGKITVAIVWQIPNCRESSNQGAPNYTHHAHPHHHK